MENNTLSAITDNITTITLSETTGNITREYIEIPVEVKDENGNKVVVMRKCRNQLAVSSLSTIDILSQVRTKSLKMLVLAMGKITDEHAQAVDKSLKTAKALIRRKFPEYSENTISKYRRIALLFSNDITSATDFSYISFIEEDTPISNLDCILTLIDLEDVEKASIEERQKAVAMFYDKYIVTDLIHLSASQTTLKKEVHDILNPAIEVTVKVVDDETKAEETKAEETEPLEEAQLSIEKLKLIFNGNNKAQKALATLMEELSKLF